MIPITNDALGEPTETFVLNLENPSAGTLVAVTDAADVNILDDEAAAANFLTVTNTDDTGTGSLRQAILDANARPGLDYVTFDVPGAGPHTIRPVSDLPKITDSITIDGYTQPGAQPNSLSVGSDAILLVELDGVNIRSGSRSGLRLDKVSNSVIRGLVVNRFRASGILVGGPAGGGHAIEGNFVGTDVTGTLDRGNGAGINVGNSLDNLIGGVATGTRNVLSGNGQWGFVVQGALIPTSGNRVQGNYVGVAADGVTPLGNDDEGIRVSGINTSSALIGGTIPGAGNVIAHNRDGIDAGSGVFPTILGNSIFDNLRLGIDRRSRPNDPPDTEVQNYPVVGSAIGVDDATVVSGYLQTRPNETLRVEFFANETIEPTGFGEGKKFLGAIDTTSDATGLAHFSATLGVDLADGTMITATSTGTIGTSAFSARILVGDVLQSVNVVNTTDDSDDGVCDQQHCSLREAIHESNNHPGLNEIHFALEPAAMTIVLDRSLPWITEAVTIDGTTQPGFNGTPIVEIHADPLVFQPGLEILGGGSTVRGLVLNGNMGIKLGIGSFGHVVGEFEKSVNAIAGDNRIVGNFVGTDRTGTVALSGGNVYVRSDGNVIGGTAPQDRNLISGISAVPFVPTAGLYIGGDDNDVQGNYIGTDVTGTQAISSDRFGIYVEGRDNRIGGTQAGAGNVISGNPRGGVFVISVVNATIQGNRIGTDFTGTAALGNGGHGIESRGFVSQDRSVLIGGSEPGAGNIIAANDKSGIFISHTTTAFDFHVTIQGNSIGTDASGTVDLGNGDHGIFVDRFSSLKPKMRATIGGTNPAEGNTIAFNDAAGVAVEPPIATPILNNRIYANEGLGIDLANDGVTPNDPGDADAGPNGLANFPDLASAAAEDGLLTVEGSLSALTSTDYRLEFFLNGAADQTGFGEGETPIGSLDVSTDSSGTASFTAEFMVDADAGQFVTATATDGTGNTSEFSQAVEVIAAEAENVAPSVAADHDPVAVDEGDRATNTGTFSDPDLDIVSVSASAGTISQSGTQSGTWSWSYPTVDGPDDSQLVAITATDSDGAFSTTTFQLNVNNVAPTVAANNDLVTVNEGDTATHTGTFSDPGFDLVNITASIGTISQSGTQSGTWSWSYPTADGPDDSQLVVITATDSDGAFSTTTFQLDVNNVEPTVGPIMITPDPVVIPIGEIINASASFTDPGTGDTHDSTWDWGDGTTSSCPPNSADCTLDQLTYTVTSSHVYTTPGVYTVTLSVSDDDGGTGQSIYQFIVVFDPNDGFVTGGVTIDSPAGAYGPDPTLTGLANFGFVAKYKTGQTIPGGNTTFHFNAADLKFKSTDYEWLVVAGSQAKFEGHGTINGAGNFGFRLSAVDEALTASRTDDLIRIKIWDKDNGDAVVYDNELGNPDDAEPTTAISGGSIVIHQPSAALPAVAGVPLPGDSNLDGIFDSGDLLHVFKAGRYETGLAANFVEGDWNRDGFFNSSDFVAIFQAGHYAVAALPLDSQIAAASLFADDPFLNSLRKELDEKLIEAIADDTLLDRIVPATTRRRLDPM